jgi:hypothetical protein
MAEEPTETEFRTHITAFSETISRQALGLARYRPEVWGQATKCFENAKRQFQDHGGRVQFGWMFHHRLVSAFPGSGYLIAAHHAVWHAPDGHLFDVTPFHSDLKHRPLAPSGHVLFLVDDHAQPIARGQLIGPLPSKFYPLGSDERLIDHVRRLSEQEEEQCRKIYDI